jgi:hypothetical protein
VRQYCQLELAESIGIRDQIRLDNPSVANLEHANAEQPALRREDNADSTIYECELCESSAA